MSAKKKEAQTAEVGQADMRLLRIILEFQQGGRESLIPALIGTSGSGKTARSEQLAKDMGLPFLRWLLSQELPEDVGGYPKVIQEGDKQVADFILTRIIRRAIQEPCFILLDEIDKVQPQVIATVLTLMADRCIRGESLHPQTVLMVAGQPVEISSWLADETNKALAARCVWFGVRNNWDFVGKRVSLPLEWLRNRTEEPIGIPVQKVSARVLDRAMGFIKYSQKVLSHDERRIYLYGCMSPNDADSLLAELGQASWLDLEAAIKTSPLRVIESMSVNDLAANAFTFLRHCTDEKSVRQMVQKILHNGTDEHRRLFMASMIDGFKKEAPNVGDSVEICKGIPDAVLTTIFKDSIIAAKSASEAEAEAGRAAKEAAQVQPTQLNIPLKKGKK